MKKIILLTMIFCSHALAGGDEINNGGGIAEKNTMFAYQTLHKHIKTCLSAQACNLTAP